MGLFNTFGHKQEIKNISLQRSLPKMQAWKIDTICASTSRNCSLCAQYNHKTYSFYGWNKKYPRLPALLYQRTCPQCGKIIGITMNLLNSK